MEAEDMVYRLGPFKKVQADGPTIPKITNFASFTEFKNSPLQSGSHPQHRFSRYHRKSLSWYKSGLVALYFALSWWAGFASYQSYEAACIMSLRSRRDEYTPVCPDQQQVTHGPVLPVDCVALYPFVHFSGLIKKCLFIHPYYLGKVSLLICSKNSPEPFHIRISPKLL